MYNVDAQWLICHKITRGQRISMSRKIRWPYKFKLQYMYIHVLFKYKFL